MLRSLYAYKGTHARTLAFGANENFIEIGVSRDPNWIHVISEKGILGYVPKNYVSIHQVPPLEMLEMIDSCIERIHLAASKRGGEYSRLEHEALQTLVDHRQEWHNKVSPSLHPSKRPAPPPPHRTTSQLSVDSLGSNVSEGSLPSPSQLQPSGIVISDQSTPKVKEISSLQRQSSEIETTTSFISRGDSLVADEKDINGKESMRNLESDTREDYEIPSLTLVSSPPNFDGIGSNTTVPKGYLRQLVQKVRSTTNISFSTSEQVVNLVLHSLEDTFPHLSSLVSEIKNENRSNSEEKYAPDSVDWEASADGQKLVEVLEKLRQCKDDGQQRSWALHEDEFNIKQLLNELLDVLTNGEMEICNHVLMLDDHRPLLTLVQYYQMETRWNLRKLLLQVFTNICQISSRNISYLSSSVLPLELSREILDSEASEEELQYTVLVLGIILCMGDTLPYTHFSIMNETFVKKLLDGVEIYSSNPETESLGELYLTLLLAFNLQFHMIPHREGGCYSENLIINVLSHQTDFKYFIEKILILFNREEDPVHMFDHKPDPPHSVLCMIVDIFQCEATAKLLYTNDEKVLCDIILRQLIDLPPEDKRRFHYLQLLEGVVVLGRWKEHKHRLNELTEKLKSIALQSDFPEDKIIAERILNHAEKS